MSQSHDRKPLRAAIVGCGVIAPTHRDALAALDGVELSAVVDPDVGAAERLAPGLPYASDLASVARDLDLVCICTPHHLHRPVFETALAAGCHVIQEKPLATTPQDLDAMVAAAEAAAGNGQTVACIFQHRFAPQGRALASALAGGRLGRVQSAHYHFRCTRSSAYYRAAGWRGTWSGEGGGLLINQAIHGLDLLVTFLGRPLVVEGRVGNRRLRDEIEVEDEASGRIGFADDVQCTVDAVNDQITGWDNLITISTDRGDLVYSPDGGGVLRASDHRDGDVLAEIRAADDGLGPAVAGKQEYGNHHARQIAEFVDAVRDGRPPRVTVADGAWANRIVLGFYASTARGGPVVLDDLAGQWRRPACITAPV